MSPRCPSDQGTIGELLVSADLLARGYAVFRAMSPACPCDLIAMRSSEVTRVEVRTGSVSTAGTLSTSLQPKDDGRFDVLAVAVAGQVGYLPGTLSPGERFPWPVTPAFIAKLERLARTEVDPGLITLIGDPAGQWPGRDAAIRRHLEWWEAANGTARG